MLSARSAAAALGLLLPVACAQGPADRPGGPLRIVATTTTLASIARGAAGSRPDVRSLVPTGVSPEDFQPSPDTIAALRNADVLVENGAGMEGWLEPTIRNAANAHLRIVVCTAGLPVVNGNPHLWMDPERARAYASKIAEAVIAADAAGAGEYRSAASAYDRQLVALTARTRTKLAAVPADRRTMIVFHDAFDYYARRFGLRIVGAIEPLAGAEPNPAHLADLVRLARAQHVRAVFAEHEYSDKLARALAESAGGLKVAFLYDDSLTAGGDADTYVAMIDTDTDTIVAALR
jgi:manganese/iron transport system substrate-binding protein